MLGDSGVEAPATTVPCVTVSRCYAREDARAAICSPALTQTAARSGRDRRDGKKSRTRHRPNCSSERSREVTQA